MNTRGGKSWILIKQEVLRRINERIWQPGDLIPNEAELAIEFKCARTTVNRALRDLAASGIVNRKRKAGTRIAINPPQKATLTIPIIRNEVENRGAHYHNSLLIREQRALPTHLSGAFRVSGFTPLVYTKTVHYADNQPFIFEERYTSLQAVPSLKEADLEKISVNEWLVQNAPYSGGAISFFAISSDEQLSKLFDAPLRTPLFATERSTWNGEQPITHVRMVYAPGYRMRTNL